MAKVSLTVLDPKVPASKAALRAVGQALFRDLQRQATDITNAMQHINAQCTARLEATRFIVGPAALADRDVFQDIQRVAKTFLPDELPQSGPHNIVLPVDSPFLKQRAPEFKDKGTAIEGKPENPAQPPAA